MKRLLLLMGVLTIFAVVAYSVAVAAEVVVTITWDSVGEKLVFTPSPVPYSRGDTFKIVNSTGFSLTEVYIEAANGFELWNCGAAIPNGGQCILGPATGLERKLCVRYTKPGMKVESTECTDALNVNADLQGAIDRGVGWLAAKQDPGGWWGDDSDKRPGVTGLAVKKLEHDAILRGYDSPFDTAYPFNEEVQKGLNFLFQNASIVTPLDEQPAGDPDTDLDDIGVSFGSGYLTNYSTGIALMAISESTTPDRIVNVPGSVVDGWTYYQVAEDVMNWIAYAQTEAPPQRGGWYYYANSSMADQSNSGYATLGLGYAEASPSQGGFGMTIPQFVKDELGDPSHATNWIDHIQYSNGGSGYDGPPESGDTCILETGNLIFEMALYGDPLTTPRVQAAVDYIGRNWHTTLNNDHAWPAGWLNEYQAMYTMMKGFEAYQITNINTSCCGVVDWFAEVSDTLIAWQNANGSWGPGHSHWAYGDTVLTTAWALLTAQKAAPQIQACPTVKIEKTHDTYQGQYEFISVTLEDFIYEMGGFDFLIAYDASALAFIEATPGQLLEDCGWEYFTYRYGPHGNCGDACPSGLLRIIAIAETNNGANHPSCYGPPDTDPYEIAELKFLVTDDRTFECQYVPIYFFWADCGDNAISDVSGDTLYIDLRIYDFEGNLIWDEDDDDEYPEDARIPFVGAPDYCLNPDPEKPTAIRALCFWNGGIDIVCADSIDVRGDINLNEVPNEIADAVMFANYFVYGMSVFTVNPPGQIAASDVNADGITLSVADLVYLIRVVVGDASPYPKPVTPVVASYEVGYDGVMTVAEDVSMGAALVVVEGKVTPTLLADDMDLLCNFDGKDTRILVYSIDGNSFTGDFLKLDGKVLSVEMATANASPVVAELLPSHFALHQNYPNPFNPITTLSFDVTEPVDYVLTIYNVGGQTVKRFSGRADPGTERLEWDASACASGVYLYKLEAGNFTDTKKMVLLK